VEEQWSPARESNPFGLSPDRDRTYGEDHSSLGFADLEARVHDFVVPVGRDFVGWRRVFLEAHEGKDLRAKLGLVEIDRLFAAAIEHQIGLHFHCRLLRTLICRMW